MNHYYSNTPVVVPPAPTAASFNVSNLSITPALAKVGDLINIMVTVNNNGGSSGSYTVNLKVNGTQEKTTPVTLNAGASSTVAFAITKQAAAAYSVDVNGLVGSFTVTAPVPPTTTATTSPVPTQPTTTVTTPSAPATSSGTNAWLIIGIIAAVIVIGLVVWMLMRRNKSKA